MAVDRKALATLVKDSLDAAQEVWRENGRLMVKASMLTDSVSSVIPGHPVVGEAVVDSFIALALDMRDSSKHLRIAISKHDADVSLLQRVYYETSALLAAAAWAINGEGGRVTEFLGDGVLALFSGAKDEGENHPAKMFDALHAAEACVGPVRDEINSALAKRYRLPPIDIGVGLAWSKCIVQQVGLPGDLHPKAIGECVYLATKFSKQVNEILVDPALECVWPVSKGGPLSFGERQIGPLKLKAYAMKRKDQ